MSPLLTLLKLVPKLAIVRLLAAFFPDCESGRVDIFGEGSLFRDAPHLANILGELSLTVLVGVVGEVTIVCVGEGFQRKIWAACVGVPWTLRYRYVPRTSYRYTEYEYRYQVGTATLP